MSTRPRRIAELVDRGALIACSTDTIWGFSCHPLRSDAIRRLLQLKRRPLEKGLILIGSDWPQFAPYLQPGWLERLQSTTPDGGRPTTWVVPAATDCPPWISPDGRSLALRRCLAEPVRSICDRLDAPLVSTSANRSGQPVARNRFVVERQFGTALDAVIGPHETLDNPPSRIVDLQSGRILRP